MAIWLCRAGRNGEYEAQFLEDDRVYCNWDELAASLGNFRSKKEIQEHFIKNDSVMKTNTASNWAVQLWAFYHVMKPDDLVILPSKVQPTVHVGRITSDYKFDPNVTQYRHYREVKWIAKDIPKTDFDQDIIYTLGALMTICRIKQEGRVQKTVSSFMARTGNGTTTPPRKMLGKRKLLLLPRYRTGGAGRNSGLYYPESQRA